MPRDLLILLSLCTLFFTGVTAQEEDDQDLPWSVHVGARYVSRFTNYGIDLGQDNAALPLAIGVSHSNGLSFTGEAVNVFGPTGGFQQSSIALEYERSLSDLFTVSLEFTHFFYRSDTMNVLSGLSNSLSINADVDFESVSVSVFYDMYLGGTGASYFGVSASGYFAFGDVVGVPVFQLGFVSQEVQGTFLKSNRGKSRAQIGTGAQSVTGISNASLLLVFLYPLGQGFSASLTPSFIYSPSELARRTSQFIWSAGIRYSVDF